jgi:hypothetical protein
MKYLFTFEPNGSAKVLTDAEGESFIAVYAKKYPQAVKKVLSMQLPNIETEADLKWISTQEEPQIDESDFTEAIN